MKARLKAMQQHPPSEGQLLYLKALGFEGPVPSTMAEASQHIEQLKRDKGVA